MRVYVQTIGQKYRGSTDWDAKARWIQRIALHKMERRPAYAPYRNTVGGNCNVFPFRVAYRYMDPEVCHVGLESPQAWKYSCRGIDVRDARGACLAGTTIDDGSYDAAVAWLLRGE